MQMYIFRQYLSTWKLNPRRENSFFATVIIKFWQLEWNDSIPKSVAQGTVSERISINTVTPDSLRKTKTPSKHSEMNPSHSYTELWCRSVNHQALSRMMWMWEQVHTFVNGGEVRENTPHPPAHPFSSSRIRFTSPEEQDLSCRNDSAEHFPSTWLRSSQTLARTGIHMI